MTTKKAMTKNMEIVYNRILWTVNNARTKDYDEWRGVVKDHRYLREMYDNERLGILLMNVDGRTLAALERRGLIKYYDNMEHDCWEVYLIEE